MSVPKSSVFVHITNWQAQRTKQPLQTATAKVPTFICMHTHHFTQLCSGLHLRCQRLRHHMKHFIVSLNEMYVWCGFVATVSFLIVAVPPGIRWHAPCDPTCSIICYVPVGCLGVFGLWSPSLICLVLWSDKDVAVRFWDSIFLHLLFVTHTSTG